MADDKATSTSTAPAAATTGNGVTKAEFGSLESKVDALIEALHGGGREAVKTKLEENTSIADQVQAELDRRDADAKTEADRLALTTVQEELARMKESVPVPVLTRRTKFLFGNPDRQAAGK